MKDTSLRYIGLRLAFVLVLVVVANLVMYTLLYADTFTPLSLPYSEDFDHLQRLVYRQFGGSWQVKDGALIQTDQNGTDLLEVIPLMLDANLNYRFETTMRFVSGAKGGGLMFNLQHADNHQQSQLVRFGVDEQGQSYLGYGYFDENLVFTSQGSVTPFPTIANADGATLAVIVHGQHYDVVVNGDTIQADIPLQYFGGHPALTTWFSQIAFDDVKIESLIPPATPVPVTSAGAAATIPPDGNNGLLFSDSFDDVANQMNWQRFSGDWTFEPGALTQTNITGFDYGASELTAFEQYTLHVQFSHRQGEGGGVLFNMPNRDSQRGAQMVRYFPDNSLVWGYFNERGEFQGQGSKTVTPAGTDDHTLDIRADGSTYAISLDGSPVVDSVPLLSKSGYVGLTASQSAVSFEQVDVLNLGAASTVTDQGDWQRSGETITQQNNALVPSYSTTGVSAETFHVAVQITATDGVGGGLAFGAASNDNAAGAHLIRLTNGGRGLEWGILDTQQNFQSQGSTSLGEAAGAPHTLELSVAANTYTILVDGTTIASDLPLQSQAGSIEFASLGGPVTFANFKLSLTQIAS